VQDLPTLPEEKQWSWDAAKNCHVTAAEETLRTSKKPEPLVKYHATPEHPAQVELVAVDKVVGTWSTVHMSGALSKGDKELMQKKVEVLLDAVKVAREEANSAEITMEKDLGKRILSFVFSY
jgi:hydrogenase maturation factor